MKRSEVIKELKQYFKIEELVCPHTVAKFGDKSWQFLDTEILQTLLALRREILKVPLVLNDYVYNGKNTQRGLRCNICPLVRDKTSQGQVYLSAHVNGAGLDIVSAKMTAQEMRDKIDKYKHMLPHPVRMESGVTWLHIDCYDSGNGARINYFKG